MMSNSESTTGSSPARADGEQMQGLSVSPSKLQQQQPSSPTQGSAQQVALGMRRRAYEAVANGDGKMPALKSEHSADVGSSPARFLEQIHPDVRLSPPPALFDDAMDSVSSSFYRNASHGPAPPPPSAHGASAKGDQQPPSKKARSHLTSPARSYVPSSDLYSDGLGSGGLDSLGSHHSNEKYTPFTSNNESGSQASRLGLLTATAALQSAHPQSFKAALQYLQPSFTPLDTSYDTADLPPKPISTKKPRGGGGSAKKEQKTTSNTKYLRQNLQRLEKEFNVAVMQLVDDKLEQAEKYYRKFREEPQNARRQNQHRLFFEYTMSFVPDDCREAFRQFITQGSLGKLSVAESLLAYAFILYLQSVATEKIEGKSLQAMIFDTIQNMENTRRASAQTRAKDRTVPHIPTMLPTHLQGGQPSSGGHDPADFTA